MWLADKDGSVWTVVNKLMFGCGALAWYQKEYDDLEIRKNGIGRWLFLTSGGSATSSW